MDTNDEQNGDNLDSLSPPKPKKRRRNSALRTRKLPPLTPLTPLPPLQPPLPQTATRDSDDSDHTIITGNVKLPSLPPLTRLYHLDWPSLDTTNTPTNGLSNADIDQLIPQLNEFYKKLEISQLTECVNIVNNDCVNIVNISQNSFCSSVPTLPLPVNIPLIKDAINVTAKQPEESASNNTNNYYNKVKHKEKVMKFQSPHYCVRLFRKVIHTRHSSRLKNNSNTAANESIGDMVNSEYSNDIENANWDELDGTRYECNVGKSDVDEEQRKQMLSTINGLKFHTSYYDNDCGVFYSFSSLESDRTKGILSGFLQLDYNGVKNVRFNGECVTCLSVLSGTLTLTTETNRQRKIETGYKLSIPHHTSYQLRNLSVETCYIYFQVSRLGIT